MPTFSNLSSLTDYVQKVTIPSMSKLLEPVMEAQLSDSIYKTVYSGRSGGYERTFSLLSGIDSYSFKEDGQTYVYADILPSKITGTTYASFYDNGRTDNRQYIDKWLNDGHRGYYKGYAINYAGRNYYGLAQKEINKNAKSFLSNVLKTLGYKVSK